jgi:hypothetical protein
MCYRLDGRSSIPVRGRRFFTTPQLKDLALGPTQPRIHWVPRALSPVVKRPGREADHSVASSAEVKNIRAIPPLLHTFSWRGAQLNEHSVKFTFLLPFYFVCHVKRKHESKVVPLRNLLRATPWRCIGKWRYSSTILGLVIRWMWVVSLTPWPFNPRGKSPRDPLDRMLDVSQTPLWKLWCR